jgi:hypothetical protein
MAPGAGGRATDPGDGPACGAAGGPAVRLKLCAGVVARWLQGGSPCYPRPLWLVGAPGAPPRPRPVAQATLGYRALGCSMRRGSSRTGIVAGSGGNTGWCSARWGLLHRSSRRVAGRARRRLASGSPCPFASAWRREDVGATRGVRVRTAGSISWRCSTSTITSSDHTPAGASRCWLPR